MKKANLITPEFRVSFPFLFTPQKPMQANAKEKYSVVMLFPKEADLTLLKDAVLKLIVERYGADKAKWPTLRTPFRDQGDRKLEGYTPGAIFMTASSIMLPGVVDHALQPILDPAQIYAGCYARASVQPFLYEARADGGSIMNRGVSFGLQNVQKLRDGEPLGGRRPADMDFTPVASGKAASLADLMAG